MYTRFFIQIYVFLTRYYTPKLYRAYDQRWSGDMSISRQSTHERYLSYYKSQTFDIYHSYSEILNVLFIVGTYGVILPHIWIPCLFYLILMYYKDKILSKPIHSTSLTEKDLTTYRLKYQFDNVLYDSVRSILKLIPLLMIIGNIWIFGNNFCMPSSVFPSDVIIQD